jgi:uncharacterized protein
MEFAKVREFMLNKLKKELPKELTYHSPGHVEDVYRAAEHLAGLEGISGDDLTLLLTAVLFHDSGFLIQQKEHEKVGCDIARDQLPEFGFTEDQIETICGMIMATRIPQSPKNRLEEIICDADLDYLGRDDFFTIGDLLFNELRHYGILNTEREWNLLQVKFLEGHHYFTESARNLRKEKKEIHLAMVRSKTL